MELKILALPSGNGKVYSTTDKLADYIKLGYVDTGETIEVEVTDPSKEVVEMLLEDNIVTHLRYKGDNEWRAITGGSGTDTYKLKASATDTTEGYLGDKLVAGTNVTITKNNSGANETYTIASTGGGGSGVTVYADLAAIKAVDTTSLTSGTLAQVVTLGQFVFSSTSTATGDDVRVIVPTTGGGRWLLQADSKSASAQQVVAFTSTFTDAGSSTDVVEVLEKSKSRLVKTIPFSKTSKIMPKIAVGLGDSNMGGLYVADKTQCYFGLLKTYLETNKGYTCYNMAVAGNNTNTLLSRFYKDVLPLKPDLVILGLSFTNDLLYNSANANSGQFAISTQKKDVMTIINHCKTIGADYIIIGGYPTLTPAAVGIKTCNEANEWYKRQFGDRYINIYNSLIEEDGTLSALYDYGDNTHFNTAGHMAIYQSIKKYLIESVYEKTYFNVLKSSKGVKIPTDTTSTNGFGMTYYFTTPSEIDVSSNFSTLFEVIPTSDIITKLLHQIVFTGGSTYINIETNASGYLILGLSGTTILTTTVKPTPGVINRMELVFCSGTKKFSLYVNEELAGTSTAAATAPTFSPNTSYNSAFVLLGSAFPATKNCSGYIFRNFAMYKCSLGIDELKEYAEGIVNTSSLLYFNPLNGVNSVGYINYAVDPAWFRSATGYTLTDGDYYYTDYSTAEKTKLTAVNAVGTAVASATTVTVPANKTIFHVTGTTAISTINLPYTGFTGKISIIPDEIFTFDTAGNIAETYTATVNRCIDLVYDGTKWYRV